MELSEINKCVLQVEFSHDSRDNCLWVLVLAGRQHQITIIVIIIESYGHFSFMYFSFRVNVMRQKAKMLQIDRTVVQLHLKTLKGPPEASFLP